MSTTENSLAALLGNPFATKAWPAAWAAFDLGQARGNLKSLLAQDRVLEAEASLLAAATARACLEHPRPLDAALIDARGLIKLPQTAGAYLRIASAAGRCFRALNALAGQSAAMQRVRQRAFAACFGQSLTHALALSQVIHDHDVLVLGETGTGKEAVARALCEGALGDDKGHRAPTGAINAASLPESLLASELFGHVRGAFTGATHDRPGRLRAAQGGSFFLDEVGDLPETTQVNLLRVIETDEVSPLGSEQTYPVKLRYIAATHKNLLQMVENGRFRQDLYERLAGLVIHLPPLRERPEDIPEIGEAFMSRYVPKEAPARQAAHAYLQRVCREERAWVGNVRELQNQLRSVLLGLPAEAGGLQATAVRANSAMPIAIAEARASMDELQFWYAQRVVDAHAGNLAQASRVLQIDRSTLARRLRHLPRQTPPQ